MKRDWSLARAKVMMENGGRCRICGDYPAEAAHLISRQYDDVLAPGVRQVNPNSVIGLCRAHHYQHDQHELDLLAHLRREEEVDCVSRVGIERSYRRLCPSLYATETTTEAAL